MVEIQLRGTDIVQFDMTKLEGVIAIRQRFYLFRNRRSIRPEYLNAYLKKRILSIPQVVDDIKEHIVKRLKFLTEGPFPVLKRLDKDMVEIIDVWYRSDGRQDVDLYIKFRIRE